MNPTPSLGRREALDLLGLLVFTAEGAGPPFCLGFSAPRAPSGTTALAGGSARSLGPVKINILKLLNKLLDFILKIL